MRSSAVSQACRSIWALGWQDGDPGTTSREAPTPRWQVQGGPPLSHWSPGPALGTRTRRCSHQGETGFPGDVWVLEPPSPSACSPVAWPGGSSRADADSLAVPAQVAPGADRAFSMCQQTEAELVNCRTYAQLSFYPSVHPPTQSTQPKHQTVC